MNKFQKISYVIFSSFAFCLAFYFLLLAFQQREENFENYENGKIYFEEGNYSLALECFEKIGPNWQDSSEWIEKTQKAVDKESGICPYCNQEWRD
jgi:tetratricopeptide (TPR) repeat protein